MAERRALQTRCREFKRFLPPGAKCTASNETLRSYIVQAEIASKALSPVAPEPRKAAAPVVRVASELGLSNDLVDIVATYTVPSITERLITLDRNIATRLAYDSAFGLWRRKVNFELRGVVFDDSVIRRNGGPRTWYSYYRIVNGREYGTPAILTSQETLVSLPHSDSIGFSVQERHPAQAHIFTKDAWRIYHIKSRGAERYELLHTIPLKGAIWAGQVVGPKKPYYVITERGELFEYYRGKLGFITGGILRGIGGAGTLEVLERSLGWGKLSSLDPVEFTRIYPNRGFIVWQNKHPTEYSVYTSDGTGKLAYYEPTHGMREIKWTQEIPVVLFTLYVYGLYDISIEGHGSKLPYLSDTARYFYRGPIPAIRCFSFSNKEKYHIPYLLLADGTVTEPVLVQEDPERPLTRITKFPPIYLAQTEGTIVVVTLSD